MRMPFEDWSYAASNQGTPKISGIPPEPRRKAWNRFTLTDLRRNQPADILISDF